MLFYFGRPKKQIKKLQGVQNNIAWFVTDTRKYDHITQVLIELHFPLVEKRIVFTILLLTFKCLHVLAPSYLSELIVKKKNLRGFVLTINLSLSCQELTK